MRVAGHVLRCMYMRSVAAVHCARPASTNSYGAGPRSGRLRGRFVAGQRVRAGLQLDDVVGRIGVEDGGGMDERHGKSPVSGK